LRIQSGVYLLCFERRCRKPTFESLEHFVSDIHKSTELAWLKADRESCGGLTHECDLTADQSLKTRNT